MKTLAYATVIAAVLGVLGWNKFQEYWGRRHEILGQTIRQQLELFAPEWEVTFDSAELKDDATVVLTNVAVGVRGRSEPLLDLREIEINLDRSLITNQQQAFPTKVVLRHPRVLVERGPDGFWNWENIPRIPQSDNPIPVIELEQGTLFLQVAAHDMLPSTEFAIQQIHIEVTPTGFRELSIRGESALDVVGSLEFQGGVNLNNGYWHVAGICPELREAGRLVGLATGISPQAQSRFDLIAQSTARGRSSSDSTAPGGLPPKPIQTVGAATIDEFGGMSHANGVGTSPLFTIPQLGVSANVAVAFHVSSEGPDSWVQYQVQTRIKDGIIDNPALPIPLQNLSGEVYVDNSQIVLKEVRARNGDSDLFLDGTIPQSQPPEAMQGVTQGVSQSTSQGTKPGTTSFLMQAKNLAFDRQMRSLLPVGMLKLYDSLQPAGRFDIDASYVDDGKSAPKLTLREFIARDCSVLPEAFQYPVTQVQAKVWQEGDLFQVTGTGVCAGQTCTAAGWFRDPGPRVQASLVLRGQNLPINEQSIAALKLPSQQGARTTLERMQLRGLADAELVLTKTGIEGEKMKMTLNGVVHDASLNYQLFPYAITGFSGRVSVDPLSPDPAQRDVWHFTEMTGRHGDAALQAEAHLGTVGGRKVLNMQVSATAVPIDRELHTACVTASPAMQEVFSSLMEGGQLDAQGINIVWSPGVPLSISVPSLIATNARVRLQQFPFPWERVNASMQWDRNRLLLSSLTGWHGDETYLQINRGEQSESAIFELLPDGPFSWHLHLEDIHVRKLNPNLTFRRALPESVASVVETLAIQREIDLDFGLDMKGVRDQPGEVTAAWDVKATLPSNDLSVGVDLKNVSGVVRIPQGAWDGNKVVTEGYFEFEQATVLDFPVTSLKGPFLVDGDEIVAGVPNWTTHKPRYDSQINPHAGNQVQAAIYGGRIGLDALVRLSSFGAEQTDYRLNITLRDAKLEEWARSEGLSRERLQGPVNGEVSLVGRGSSDRNIAGNGWVQISPAQLYELPVVAQMMSVLELRQPETTAFKYAYGEFAIKDGQFEFSLIDLVGESLRLVGRGTVAFGYGLNERLAIDFFRSRIRSKIPVVGQLFQAVTQNMIGVKVRGTVSNHTTEVQPKLGVIDDAMRPLLEGFNNGQMPILPRPQFLPNRNPPQPRRPTIPIQ